jgi:predicted dehydrogenase
MEPLVGALVGFGFIAERGHVPAYLSGAAPLRIVAVAEPCAGRQAAARRTLPEARVYPSAMEMLARESLDFVDICAPPSEHLGVALDAFDRGLHVLCEKPLAITPAQASAMAYRAIRAQRVLYPGHSYRHAPVVRAVRSVIERDAIGPITLATIDTYRTGHALGAAEWHPDWRRDLRFSGGGILMDHGPHTSYLAFEWMGGHPSAVSAWTRSSRGDGVEDDAMFAMAFERGVVRAHLTWNAGFRRVIYTLHGQRGALRVEDDEVEIALRQPGGVARYEKIQRPSDWGDAGHGAWFRGVLCGFAEAIEARDFVGRETRDAMAGMRVIAAAQTSARHDGAPVSLSSLTPAIAAEEHSA